MPERKPLKSFTITRPSKLIIGPANVEITFSPRGWPVLKIWGDADQIGHIRLAKSNTEPDTFDRSFVGQD